LASYIGFDFKKGVIAESAHPFTTNLHNEDVRITTHYFEDNLESAIFSTIHESGHALYEMGVANELSQTPVGGGASCGMHESQSRFFENIIGRSKAFWEPIYGKLVDTFPENLANVDLDHFVKAINKVQPDYIRTEADELTYCLHIMIRYEIEKKIFEEDYPVEDLPKLWQQLYEEYLGLEPMDDAKGILQDIHWAQGSFGYFPSYALGNAFASQIYHQMSKELKVDDLLRDGKVCVIVEYLRENIHKYGASRKARRLLKDLTGEEFNPKYYIEYLKDKFTKIYEL
ncbi:MAG: carboxypeptidase M32, partial [Lachnospiraceae bacterium]